MSQAEHSDPDQTVHEGESVTTEKDLEVQASQFSPQPTTAAPLSDARFKWLALLAILVSTLIYVMRLDHVVGAFVDDAWYVLLAQALASGQGYTLINSPTPGILPLYPPAFSFVLSLAWRIFPTFPNNVWLLKSISMAAMLGAGVIAFQYFRKERALTAHTALAIAFASVLAPSLVYLATSTVMSECFFTFCLMLTIWLIERGVRQVSQQGQWRFAIWAGLAASMAFLTRSITLGLLGGAFFYLLKQRLWLSAGIFTLTVALVCGPWTLYASTHAPTPEQRFEQVGHIVMTYKEAFWQRLAGLDEGEPQTLKDLPGRVLDNTKQIVLMDLTRILATPLFELVLARDQDARQLASSQENPWALWLITLSLTALILLGYLASVRERLTCAELAVPGLLLLILLWPWQPYRLILPLVPFFIFYLWRGMTALAQHFANVPALKAAPAVVLALLVACGLWGNVGYILRQQDTLQSAMDMKAAHDEVETMFGFLKGQLKPGEIVAAANAPQLFLYTGNKSIGVGESSQYEGFWQKLGIRYIVNMNVFGKQDDPTKTGFKIVYRSRKFPNQIWVVTTER